MAHQNLPFTKKGSNERTEEQGADTENTYGSVTLMYPTFMRITLAMNRSHVPEAGRGWQNGSTTANTPSSNDELATANVYIYKHWKIENKRMDEDMP